VDVRRRATSSLRGAARISSAAFAGELNFRPRPSNGARRRQNVPVATRTHSGQSTTPPSRAALPRNSAKESGRGLHSVSNGRVRTHDRLLDALADTTRRLTWLPLKLQTSQRHSAALCRVPDGRRKVCPVCPVQSAPGCCDRASGRHIFGRRRRRTLNLAIRTRVLAASVCLLAVRSSSCQCARNRSGLGSTSMNVLKPTAHRSPEFQP
jgi:hypothetical protein